MMDTAFIRSGLQNTQYLESKGRIESLAQLLVGVLACGHEPVSAPPNKSLEPTRTGVTDRADARSAPPARVAHL